MRPITCATCGYEFDSPALDQAGPGCPRCGELIGGPPGAWAPSIGVEVYLSAALVGSILGLLAAAILLIVRS